jgi:hypothetical protein
LPVRPRHIERFQIANRGKVVQVALRLATFSQAAYNSWSILFIQVVTKQQLVWIEIEDVDTGKLRVLSAGMGQTELIEYG